MSDQDFNDGWRLYMMLMLCGFIGTYAPNIWHVLGAIVVSGLVAALFASVDPRYSDDE